ncbi:serine acetyltransferase [Sutcliffiella horikoshii]|uniref:serine O-acetyltransferase n=1 Tax=Sutcliffiella horikoshii TaxID=79883 RepID=UPI0038503556
MITKIGLEIKNFFQLQVKVDTKEACSHFAYYLYRYNEIVHKTDYLQSNNYTFNLSEPGQYFVKVYTKVKGKKSALNSDRISFDGFRDVGSKIRNKPILIYGVSRFSAAINFVLSEKKEVKGFITAETDKKGETFFNLPILNINEITNLEEYKVVVCDGYTEELSNNFSDAKVDYEIVDSRYTDTIVNEVLRNMSAYKIYTLSRKCYLNGLIKGAKYLKGFIHHQFSSYIPYTIDLDETVAFGYGGIGVVINSNSKIGKNVKISQNVTIGSRGETPVIGDNVWIGPGSKLLGGKIGSNVVIGANSVVTKEIPDNCVVAGVPAKVISTDIEKYMHYFNKG